LHQKAGTWNAISILVGTGGVGGSGALCAPLPPTPPNNKQQCHSELSKTKRGISLFLIISMALIVAES